MPGPTRFSLLFAAYPTITAAILLAFRRLQYPFIDRIVATQTSTRLLHHSATSTASLSVPTSSSATAAAVTAAYSSSSAASAASASTAAPSNKATYQYMVSPAFRAKDRSIPHMRSTKKPEPPTDSGEDSLFYTEVQDNRTVALGVVDGVGGWNDIGVDARQFSYTLADTLKSLARRLIPLPQGEQNDLQLASLSEFSFPPLLLLDASFNHLKQSGKVQAGSSTACVGIAYSNGAFQTANLGDSGYLIFRNGKVFHSSEPQTHYFNAPYQLAIIPQKIIEQNAKYGGKNFDDKPSDAVLMTHRLMHGDVVVFVTDGVLDNLRSRECLGIVTYEMLRTGNWVLDPKSGDIYANNDKQFTGIEELAKSFVEKAYKASLDTRKDGPFAVEARRQMKVAYRGGKPDDITVVVMFVQQPNAKSVPERL
ncbi:phosphatase 2C-like domain-containing protein [Lipomyces oligophaga]|uniref:phosphatase 2C-like domain-containing protein n=1 Tax=Lipomyces oligophaga TaxID=45792 RepID=UPI0034CD4948